MAAEYIVKELIRKGYDFRNNRMINKVIAKPGTILVVNRDNKRIGGSLVLQRKDNGNYICDLGSQVAEECCEVVRESI